MDAPFDRGEVDRASLDATERLRARLAAERTPAPRPGRASLLPWAVSGALFLFTAGLIANPWFEANVRTKLPFANAEKPIDAEVTALQTRLARMEAQAAATSDNAPPPAERLARTEAQVETSTDQLQREADRIDRLSTQVAGLVATLEADRARDAAASAAVTAAADRTEAMFAVILARRSIEAGKPLGPVEALLRRGFEARHPDAVKSVAALGTAPVSIATLRRDFATLQPVVAQRRAATRQSWWDTLTGAVREAVTTEPSTKALDGPMQAAESALLRGDARAAANHLRRLRAPRSAGVTRWIAAADRLAAGQDAMLILENAAVVLPPVAVAEPATAPEATPVTGPAREPATSATPRISIMVRETVRALLIDRIKHVLWLSART